MQDSQYILDSLSEDVAGPCLKAGTAAHKLLGYRTNRQCAKVVFGIRIPIALISCSYSVVSRIASCTLAMLMCPTSGNKEAAA